VYEGLSLSVSAKNLIDDDYRETQGADDFDEALISSFRLGRSFGISASYTY
jgi:outer membrane receptor protein involved in Fe transport